MKNKNTSPMTSPAICPDVQAAAARKPGSSTEMSTVAEVCSVLPYVSVWMARHSSLDFLGLGGAWYKNDLEVAHS